MNTHLKTVKGLPTYMNNFFFSTETDQTLRN